MNVRRWMTVIGALLLTVLFLVGGLAAETPLHGAYSATAAKAVLARASSQAVVINEAMPKPQSGELQWVELTTKVQFVFLPLVLRGFGGANSGLVTSSGPRATLGGVDLRGYQVGDEDGQYYTIPSELPPVPSGAFVLIYFGEGVNDYDFADGRAVLYTGAGLKDIFEESGDQVALYASGSHTANTIVDLIAWGIPPGEDAANAATADIWQRDWFATFETGFGDVSDEDLLAADESLGRYPGSAGRGPQAFAVYQGHQLTPGADNPVPEPAYYTPENGAVVETTHFSVSWSQVPGATGYRLQLDDDPAFGSPRHDAVVADSYFKPPSPLPANTYYWRVRAIGPQAVEGPWLDPVEVGIVVFGTTSATASSPAAEVTLDITPVRQNKDSRMLCLMGDPEGDTASDDAENAWDAAAACTVPPCTTSTKHAHGRAYCVRASIRMMASHYDGSLTMDRISYHVLQDWEDNTRVGSHDDNPNNDLGHGHGMTYPDEEDEGLSWALGVTVTATVGKPSFDDIKGYIDDERPLMFRKPGHMMVLDGYREEGGEQYIHVLDPDQPPDCERWQLYSTQTIHSYWLGPEEAPDVLSDEDSVSTDTDGDGIVDFDEINRFDTSHTAADSDGDRVLDKQDMREYVFDATGTYSYRNADWDGDGLRKEVDPDNDGGKARDGCEDADRNGVHGAGETDNFDATDDLACRPVIDEAYTTDLMGNRQSTFRPGEALKLTVQASNHTTETFTITYNWTTYDPNSNRVEDLSFDNWAVSLPPGTDTWWLARGLATNALLGTYIFSATLEYGTELDVDSTAFDVQGTLIPIGLAAGVTCEDVDADNQPVGIKSSFTSEDERIYAWTAWEGASGPHTVKYEWYRPNGSFYADYSFGFDTTDTLYYTWSWIATVYMFDSGQWSVKIYVDGSYQETLTFNFTRGSAAQPGEAPRVAPAGGAAGGDALPSSRSNR